MRVPLTHTTQRHILNIGPVSLYNTWIGSIVYNMAVVFSTSVVTDGVCYGYVNWKSRLAAVIYGIWHFLSFFIVVIIGFTFCYGRILMVIRRQAIAVYASTVSHQGTDLQRIVSRT